MTPADAGSPPRFAGSDLKQIAVLLTLAKVATFLPERAWKYPCQALALVTSQRRFEHIRRLDALLPPELLERSGQSRAKFLRGQEARFLEEYVQVLREWTWRWRPPLALTGREYLESALASGRGAILWVSGFESSDLVVKKALAGAGYRAVHLSRPTHGFSTTQFGIRFLNPIRKRVEDRYLASRAVIEGDSPTAALRELQRTLRANGIASITVSDAASNTTALPLLGGALKVSTGPAHLALSTGAALIPVFTSRSRSGAFTVRLGPPLNGAAGEALSIEAMLSRYGEQLDAALTAHPEQWTGWRTGSFTPVA